MTSDDDALAVLREIRDNQRALLEHQAEALVLQREQYELYKRQYDRAERINDRAEAIQHRSSGMISLAGRALWIVLPLLALLIGMVLWPMVVQLWR